MMEIIAVIPIFVTAGSAALPTIVAVLASVLAIVFKPRELLGVCRRHPAACSIPLLVAGIGILAWWMGAGMSSHSSRAASPSTVQYDWARIAEDIIAQERAGKARTVSTIPATADAPLVLGRDFSRCSYGGGPSPAKLQRTWSFRPEEAMFLSAPLVAGRRVFSAACQSDLGGYTGLLACIDADTGKPLWQVTHRRDEPLRPFFSSPALTSDGESLLIGQGLHADKDCSLLCFEAATGRLRWEVKTTLHIESSPAIFKNMVIVGAGAIEGGGGRAWGDPGHVIAVRISDGKELWRQWVIDPESSPAIDESGTIYIGSGFNGDAVVALRSDSDEQLREAKRDRTIWRTPVGQPVTGAITLAGDLVIAGAGNGDMVHSSQDAQGLIVALDRTTGQIRWRTPFADAVLGAVARRGDMLVCPVRTGEVAALALSDGHVLWRTHISGNAPVLAGCAFTGERVYAVSSDGFLAVLRASNGEVLEKTLLNDQAQPGTGLAICSPQVVDARIIVGSETGGLHCFVGSEHTP